MKIISGGQTGSDIGGLIAAKKFGLETGGWMPKGCITETEPKPEYLELYNMKESDGGYVKRTIQNIQDADLTIIFAVGYNSVGTKLTREKCREYRKLYQIIDIVYGSNNNAESDTLSEIINDNKVSTINIAGNRQSKGGTKYDIEDFVTKYMSQVFTKLGYKKER